MTKTEVLSIFDNAWSFLRPDQVRARLDSRPERRSIQLPAPADPTRPVGTQARASGDPGLSPNRPGAGTAPVFRATKGEGLK